MHRMYSFNNLRTREKLRQTLKLNNGLYNLVRKHWRRMNRGQSERTIVTSDFYQLNEPELLKAVELGFKFVKENNSICAEILLLHVDKLIHSPSIHNSAYDPDIIYKKLSPSYRMLKDCLRSQQSNRDDK